MHSVYKRFEEEISSLPVETEPFSLYEPIRYTLQLGGKHVRPRLVLLTTKMCESNPDLALPAAKAVELLHVFTLIHDDIMDKADTRRGKLTVAKKWDENIAILSGDALFGIALEQLNEIASIPELSKEQVQGVFSTFLKAVRIVCEGQSLDMSFEDRIDVSKDEYITMIGAKTAALIAASSELGARVAGVSDELITAAYEFGWNIGTAFQIQDDYLDAVGDAQKTGKKVGGDILEGKKTYLTLTALENASAEMKSELLDIIQKDEKSDADVARVIAIYRETGTLDQTEQSIQKYYSVALDNLGKFPDNDARNEIKSLVNQLMQREK